ncbi:hypothetical protein ANANG_G00095390 [Anguilla anguilla]|uniref:E3 ubiquitin-protein ligase n=1 Tax=Anguilla anguilla TaxID=7936 RepID=A0A9D3MGA3_ANGAN|nr:hypothetical protein ANANG_G00095390 [Anguilla anguilla]
MLLASAVVVWEWLNEHGRWRPYSSVVSHHIEVVIRSDPRGGSVVLGQVDSRLSPYIIDLHSMHQFRQDTGTLRPVRRSFYDPTSAPGQGWLWEWENDAGSWTAYDMEVGVAIQAARDRQQPWVDLSPLGFRYLIDFQSMTQVNGQTQRRRRVQRRSDLAYPLVSGALPRSHAWGAAAAAAAGGLTGGLLGVGVSGTSSGGMGGALSHSLRKTRPSFTHSLSLLGPAAAALSLSSTRPPPRRCPPSRPPPPPPASSALSSSFSSISTTTSSAPLVPTATLITMATSSPTTPTAPALAPPPPPRRPVAPPPSARASLAGLSRPALHRIAMAQSRALIASGVPTVPVKNLNGSSPVHPALAGITGILMKRHQAHPGLSHCCRKTSKKQARKGKTPEEVVKKYLQKVRNPPEEDCTICMEPLGGPSGYKGPGVGSVSRVESVGRLSMCGHQYHLQCLVAMYNNGNKDGSLQCPTCKTIYGVKTGNQPPGKMEYHVIPHSLPGHPDCKTIRIIYNIPPGIQGPEHPNPGKPFTARGFPRHCYLPDSEKGRKVLRLLLVAWDRRLVFSVGTSSTTGESDTVIWNEVHHKTEFGSNLTGHGYPDPGHLDNVLEELRIQGITEDESLQHD